MAEETARDRNTEPSLSDLARAAAWVLPFLAGVTAALTLLFLGMRNVMDLGGACAVGGPFEVRQRCDDGVPQLMLAGLWGGMVLAFLYVGQAAKHRVPSFGWLLWPALFLSLGWNFLEYGFDPPGGTGTAWGWLLCAALFVGLGGVPLLSWRSVLAGGPSARAGFWVAVQMAAVAAGIALGAALFDGVTG